MILMIDRFVRKRTIILRTKKINFFKQLKETNEMGRSQTINERNKEVERADIYDNANISLLDLQRYP